MSSTTAVPSPPPEVAQAIASVTRQRPATGTFFINMDVTIDASIHEVFWFAADPQNDVYWRYEVESFAGQGDFRLGKSFREFIALSAFLPFCMRGKYWEFPMLLCKLEPPYLMELYTDPNQEFKDYYIHILRTFETVKMTDNDNTGKSKVKFKWSMEVDNRIPPLLFKKSFGLAVPNKVVQLSFVALESLNQRFFLKGMIESGNYRKKLEADQEEQDKQDSNV